MKAVMKIKHVSIILNGIYMLIVGLFILDATTPFDIKSQIVKSSVYFGLLLLTPIIFLWKLIASRSARQKIINLTLPSLMLIMIILIGPLKIVFSAGSWHTQSILYENQHFGFKKIEIQMQDVGALGNNRRVVEVIYLTNLFMFAYPAEKEVNGKPEWVKVDRSLNELELKYP